MCTYDILHPKWRPRRAPTPLVSSGYGMPLEELLLPLSLILSRIRLPSLLSLTLTGWGLYLTLMRVVECRRGTGIVHWNSEFDSCTLKVIFWLGSGRLTRHYVNFIYKGAMYCCFKLFSYFMTLYWYYLKGTMRSWNVNITLTSLIL